MLPAIQLETDQLVAHTPFPLPSRPYRRGHNAIVIVVAVSIVVSGMVVAINVVVTVVTVVAIIVVVVNVVVTILVVGVVVVVVVQREFSRCVVGLISVDAMGSYMVAVPLWVTCVFPLWSSVLLGVCV
jgi:hypothetical protein